ncbi:hypothetical protein [Metabacillus halosaccharovorans]|uniref:hypothetical protein n=1 Tax=Metabacillus halosaccharovorans TaxID=930124 RepID=UPI002042202A|nr:hypothetical protein [Metabacillus halosaccharovorans]MCM3442076.1 hypothetical protein [Metabacillus halosaccharovorans]
MDITDIISNPIVWAFLVWLFSRLFTNKSNKEEDKQKVPNQPKTRQEPRQNPRPTARPVPKPVMTTVESKKRNDGSKPPLQTVQEAYEKMKQRSSEKEIEVRVVKEQPKPKSVMTQERTLSVNRNVRQNHLVIDQNKAAQGVIWSEILGPPRAKNPHYTKTRRHS